MSTGGGCVANVVTKLPVNMYSTYWTD